MKLYATVTSERATKGQGGEYLDIDIKNSDKMVVATIKVRPDRLNGQSITVWHDSRTDVRVHKDSAWNRDIYETPYQQGKTKGEKQKGEKCAICGQPTNGISCCIPL